MSDCLSGEKNVYDLNTDLNGGTWASPPHQMDADDYLNWLKENHGQVVMILVRRLSLRVVKDSDISIQGEYAEVVSGYLGEQILSYQKSMREAGTERVPESGLLF